MKNFTNVLAGAGAFEQKLLTMKAGISDIPWYPYSTLSNLSHIEPMIVDDIDELFSGQKTIADVGGADGDISFYLESLGNSCSMYDFGPTNMNNLKGAHAVKKRLNSNVSINEINLDEYFIGDSHFDLIMMLGILYHLKNPFYVLEKLSKLSNYMILSTRIARHFGESAPEMSTYSAAYLVGPEESNGDATNFWVFTDAGLKRIIDRAGWDLIGYRTVGDTKQSNPYDVDRDERAFCVLRSR